jgi:putative ABC transport system permease protein
LPGTDVSSLLLSAIDAEHVERAVQRTDAVLRDRHHIATGESPDVTLTAQTAALTTLRESVRSLTALLSAIAAISLIVGGIGVMNIMLVSVKERRREIGVRMALGARSSDIRDQFLVESLLVSSLGGAAGLTLTALGVLVAQRALVGWSLELDLQAALLGFGTSAAVGAVFGFVPAHRASQIEPQLAMVRD